MTAPATARPRGLGDIVVSARPLDEYRAMFGLTGADLTAGPILDCPGGAGAFACGVRELGGEVVSVDPAYTLGPDDLVARVRAGMERAYAYLERNRASYVWSFFASADDLKRRRDAALTRFAADYRGADARYLEAALPRLPARDRRFRLALSGYLLFTYPDHLDEAWHLAALRELLRVAGEVRVFPVIDTTYVRYPRLDALRRALAAEGHHSEVRQVAYELQRGGNEMLVVSGR